MSKKTLKAIVIELLIVARLLTNDGVMLERRRPVPKKLSSEVVGFIRRPARRGRIKWFKD